MALWHFLKDEQGFSWSEGDDTVSSFDDGLAFVPGEDEFSRDAADAKATALGDGVTAEYTGTPNYSARIEQEQAAAAEAQAQADAKAQADATIDAMLNPPDPEQAAKDAVNAKYDALLAAAPDRADDIAKLREAELADA